MNLTLKATASILYNTCMSSKKPFITIITCTRNSDHFLNACLNSVQLQTYRDFEHIFIDGESTDKTRDIIKNYYPEPKIITQSPQGIYPAFNEGLRQACGDIIGFLHSDDIFSDFDCLQRIAAAFIKNKDLCYYCSKMIIYDKNLIYPFANLGAPPHIRSFKESLYSSTYFAHPTYYCRASIIKKVGLFNENYHLAADIDWLKRLEKLSLPYFFDPKPLVKFRSDGSTATHYLLALKEEFIIQRRYDGLSIHLFLIYSWHFIRRLSRLVLITLGLESLITYFRKLILKSFNN